MDVDSERPIGRVDVELFDSGLAFVSCLRKAVDGQGEIAVRPVSVDDALRDALLIARTSTARRSGFPQMTRAADRLVFAWTDMSGGESIVKTAISKADELNSAGDFQSTSGFGAV